VKTAVPGALLRLTRSAALALCLPASTVALRAADTPQPQKSDLVTVRGCLHGHEITTIDESGTNGIPPQRFVLTGNRRTLAALKKHSGHLEEVTGTLKGGTANGGTRIVEKHIDKGRVYMGVGSAPFEQPGTAGDPGAASTIEVRDFVHVGERC
jgi:hypothetical protein